MTLIQALQRSFLSRSLFQTSIHRYPLTHQTYRIRVWDRLSPAASVVLAVINVAFALVPLALILFVQVLRRRVVAIVE